MRHDRCATTVLLVAIALTVASCGEDDSFPEIPVNHAPLACFFLSPAEGPSFTEFQFDASCSQDEETPADELLFQWDWENDGVYDFGAVGNPHAAHRFEQAGNFEVVLQVSDREWTAECETMSVVVNALRARNSPENLLWNLKQAYDLRNIAEYESLLAGEPESFTFVLSQTDQEEPGLPDGWGRQTEVEIHQHLFNPDAVPTLSLSYAVGPREWDPEANLWSILITNVHLHVYGLIPGREGEGMFQLMVEYGSSRFWFREEPWGLDGVDGHVWKIVKWEDEPLAGSWKGGGLPLSWGRLKYIYW
ncbi:MAG: PKD domain-containing protein [Candidatus Eisenbacteria bacterium]|nr:PKD domain-containing protein [Candidatus Eisenbacteria bacterium]